MEHKVYSIRDAKAEIFNLPFFKKTHGEAERDFNTLVNDDKSSVHAYPDDFDLYYVGTYDDCTGKLLTLDTPQHIVKAVQLVKKQLTNWVKESGPNALLVVIRPSDTLHCVKHRGSHQNEAKTINTIEIPQNVQKKYRSSRDESPEP